jgi:hypothetical protein
MFIYSITYEKWNRIEDINFDPPFQDGYVIKELKAKSFDSLLAKISKFKKYKWAFWSATSVEENDWLQSLPRKVRNSVIIYRLFIKRVDGRRLSGMEISKLDHLCQYRRFQRNEDYFLKEFG